MTDYRIKDLKKLNKKEKRKLKKLKNFTIGKAIKRAINIK